MPVRGCLSSLADVASALGNALASDPLSKGKKPWVREDIVTLEKNPDTAIQEWEQATTKLISDARQLFGLGARDDGNRDARLVGAAFTVNDENIKTLIAVLRRFTALTEEYRMLRTAMELPVEFRLNGVGNSPHESDRDMQAKLDNIVRYWMRNAWLFEELAAIITQEQWDYMKDFPKMPTNVDAWRNKLVLNKGHYPYSIQRASEIAGEKNRLLRDVADLFGQLCEIEGGSYAYNAQTSGLQSQDAQIRAQASQRTAAVSAHIAPQFYALFKQLVALEYESSALRNFANPDEQWRHDTNVTTEMLAGFSAQVTDEAFVNAVPRYYRRVAASHRMPFRYADRMANFASPDHRGASFAGMTEDEALKKYSAIIQGLLESAGETFAGLIKDGAIALNPQRNAAGKIYAAHTPGKEAYGLLAFPTTDAAVHENARLIGYGVARRSSANLPALTRIHDPIVLKVLGNIFLLASVYHANSHLDQTAQSKALLYALAQNFIGPVCDMQLAEHFLCGEGNLPSLAGMNAIYAKIAGKRYPEGTDTSESTHGWASGILADGIFTYREHAFCFAVAYDVFKRMKAEPNTYVSTFENILTNGANMEVSTLLDVFDIEPADIGKSACEKFADLVSFIESLA